MKTIQFTFITLLTIIIFSWPSHSHDARSHNPNNSDTSATYIANEAILVQHGDKKILFDPFFHQNFGIYQLVPAETKKKIFAAQAPFDNIDAIVISHAHGDHFAADQVLAYLSRYKDTHLIAPQQAIDQLTALPGADDISAQLTGIKLAFNDAPKNIEVSDLIVEAVRIPHAGWPSRADIENIVFRITLPKEAAQNKPPFSVIHMGDADPDDNHYLPYKSHWQARKTDVAFPPYWFYSSLEGNYILEELINTKQSVGIHVPMKVPKLLQQSDKDYFSRSGETRVFN
jgi:L-ascorbate metabolism protein UlaG (beta-lactamase superfamily)